MSDISFQRHLPIAGTYNIRDLGGYSAGEGTTLWRRMLRADGLHRVDGEGMAALVHEGVATVIDLRNAAERAAQPNPFRDNGRVRYHAISLFDNLAPTYGPQSDTLFELYICALSERRSAIAEVLTLIAEAEGDTVLFHCTAGKDRTGLIAALLLANAGVEMETIVEDYALTKDMIAPLLGEFLQNAALHGTDAEGLKPFLACAPETMRATLAHIVAKYRSIADYLIHAGLSEGMTARLRSRLLEG